MLLIDNVASPLPVREPLTFEQVRRTPTDQPLVLQYFSTDGWHFVTCLRQPSMKRDRCKLTMYPSYGDIWRLVLVPEDLKYGPEGQQPRYKLTAPGEKEEASCWRILARYEDQIMGEEE